MSFMLFLRDFFMFISRLRYRCIFYSFLGNRSTWRKVQIEWSSEKKGTIWHEVIKQKCDVHRQLHATIHQNADCNYCNWLEFSIFYIVDVLHKNINHGFKKSDCTLIGLMSNPAFFSIGWNAKNCRPQIQNYCP
jgi:hypothetical protein